tara:strand:- start:5 stop:1507 length:1503 start_codon:yes stop_codon:yes gene_type:complete
MYKLRDYQVSAITDVRKSIQAGHKMPILCLPTGSGKTIISIGIVQSALEKKKRVVFMAPRRELITQTYEKFMQAGINSSILMAGCKYDSWRSVTVASVDTITARCSRGKMNYPDADVVIVDECHLYDTEKRREVLNTFKNNGAVIIGLTATPARGNGKGLGRTFDDLIIPTSIGEMISKEWLCEVKYYGGTAPDTSKIKISGGDYNLKQLATVSNKKELNGSIVQNWLRIAPNKSTVVFCVDRAHSRAICDEFLSEGITAEHYDCETTDEETQAILKRVGSGETTVLCNVYKATFGLDIPSLQVAIMARPTKSIPLYYQTIGRVLRPHESKDFAIVIDHANCVKNHGFIDEEPPWLLDYATDVNKKREHQKKEKKEPKEMTCSACNTIFVSARECPNCGTTRIQKGEPIPYYDFDLEEIKKEEKKKNKDWDWNRKIEFYAGLKGYAENKGFKSGWAAFKYKEKFGVWANDKRLKEATPIAPNAETKSYITSRNIAWSKKG